MKRYTRRLPHIDAPGRPVFATFRLHGSLPANRAFPAADLTSGRAFVAMDRLLDQAATGPRYLKIAEIAILLVNALKEGEQKLFRYTLHAFVIMPNHVHLLATPNVPFTKWLAPLKGFTSYQANRILRQAGHPFWQHEGYDHLVRSEEEFVRIRRYIENNPVKAGLIATAEEYRWSSAYRGTPEKASAANSGGSRP